MSQSATQTNPLSVYLLKWQDGAAPDIAAFVKQHPDFPWEDIAAICCLDLKLHIEHGHRRPGDATRRQRSQRCSPAGQDDFPEPH